MAFYGKEQSVTFKTFLSMHAPEDGVIRLVFVKRSVELFCDRSAEWVAFFYTDPNVLPEMIIETVEHRSAIDQNCHDVKEVCARASSRSEPSGAMPHAGTCDSGCTQWWSCVN